MATIATLTKDLELCMLRERRTLLRRLESVTRQLGLGRDISGRWGELERDVAAAVLRCERRRRAVPRLAFPEELPIVERKAEIADAIAKNAVVVVCGETGSGKSTQLPKICLELGRGVVGTIGHTQPRRIAARTLASRIASELGVQMGGAVGYKVRFGDHTGQDTYVKLMTDGILLAEIEGDRRLEQYDTIIIDEAHERSLNIDFILGYLKGLSRERPDLKVIVTSATIDALRFADHFGGAPVIEVSGRTFPVEVRHRAAGAVSESEDDEEDELTLEDRVSLAVEELSKEGRGDVLVFLPTERAIRETAERLEKDELVGTEILPLFAKLSASEQNRIFEPRGGRRIVLATNVAETSLTVPGIRYVVDSGLARVRRYDPRRGVERLPIERVSQASARQRAGRCGRTSAGICVRLYSEEDFASRAGFTTPEIGRSNLAGVILRMAALGLGSIDEFPFVDPPERRAAKDAYDALLELGAIDEEHRLTTIGRKLARLPVDPRIARMMLAGYELGCLRDVLVIAAALSAQDPRERPQDEREKADHAHRAFHGETSDFSSLLLLFRAYQKEANGPKSKLRAFCKKNFLSFVRMREWIDVHAELEEQMRELDYPATSAKGGDDAAVHRALLTGLLRNVAMRFDDRTYVGARNVKLHLHPSSSLLKKRPPWIMAAEMVETDRLYARTVGKIDPEWIEGVAEHVVGRSYAEPHWDAGRGQVVAFEKVTLYGLPVARHTVDFGRIDAETAREIFIRSALVEGEIVTQGSFQRHNGELLRSLEALAERARRRDLAIDERAVFAFFDERVPADVHSTISFERWRKIAEQADPRLLCMTREHLAGEGASLVSEENFPSVLRVGDHAVELRYRFAPGDEDDGITAVIALPIVHLLDPRRFEWMVPGMLAEKIDALIESLPKALRKALASPAKNLVELVGAFGSASLLEALATALSAGGVAVKPSDFRLELVREHLSMRFEVVGDKGKIAGCSRDFRALARGLADRAREAYASVPKETLEKDLVTSWDFGDLPEKVQIRHRQVSLVGFPALAVEGDHVALRVFDSPERAESAHRVGAAALYALALSEVCKAARRAVSSATCLHYAGLGSADELRDGIVRAAVLRACVEGRAPVRAAAEFVTRASEARGKIAPYAAEVARAVGEVLTAYQRVLQKAERSTSAEGARAHLARLVYRGFVEATPRETLAQLPRYLKALELRIERRQHNAAKYREKEAQIEALFAAYHKSRTARPAGDAAIERYRWLLEEFHVFLFAQELTSSGSVVTERRLADAWQTLT
ncbi:MAG TPA: ATP-dependent RNA helicase HrpA [Polyangiaceae bacterium]|nr:ATP-dependent RNA helicase HrpA [Polyangiaceae bacterium]